MDSDEDAKGSVNHMSVVARSQHLHISQNAILEQFCKVLNIVQKTNVNQNYFFPHLTNYSRTANFIQDFK